jgi:ribosomal protein S6 kinase alpha-5
VFLVRKCTGGDAGRLFAMKVLEKASIVQKRRTTEHTKTERQVLEMIRNSPFLVINLLDLTFLLALIK